MLRSPDRPDLAGSMSKGEQPLIAGKVVDIVLGDRHEASDRFSDRCVSNMHNGEHLKLLWNAVHN